MHKALLISAAAAAILIAGAADAANLLTDGSFEAPVLGAGGYTYTPVGSAWSFSGSALVNGSGSNAWYGGSEPSGMDGQQFVALQGGGAISQTFNASNSTLHLAWISAGRPSFGCCNGDQSYAVLVDGAQVGGTFSTISGTNFGLNTLNLTGLTLGAHTLAFQGLTGTDETAFLDNVMLSVAPIAPPPAAPQVTVSGGNVVPAGMQVIENFDNPIAPGFSFVQDGPGSYVRSGALGLDPSVSAPPPGDLTNYETVTSGSTATLTSDRLLRSLSFYMGSPDSFNWVEFIGPGYDWTLQGSQLFNPPTAFGGDQSIGRTVSFDFGPARVNKVIFGSNGNSFEFDTLSAVAVPEPSTWAMMLVGLGGLGGVLRRRNAVARAAVQTA
jgi:hypothetical protein